MTTPAENVDDTFTSVVSHFGSGNYPGAPTFSENFVVPSGWRRKSRPASGSTHKDRETGWRDCGAWRHSGLEVTKSGGDYSSHRRWADGSEDSQTWTRGGVWNFSPFDNPSFPVNLRNRVMVEALNKIKDQDIHLGNYFVEGRQTIQMIGSAFAQIARTVRRFRNNFPREWEKVKQYEIGRLPCHLWHLIPGKWIEVQYGWNPLISDVQGAIKHLYKTAKTVGQMVNVSSKRTDFEEIWRRIDARQWAVTARTRVKLKHFCEVSLWYELESTRIAEMSSLGLINPTEWAWEAVPYSFIVDWAVPIGAWISSLTADAGWSFKGGSVSQLTKWQEVGVDCTYLEENIPGYRRTWTEGSPPLIKSKENWKFTRECLSSTPVPGIYYKNPLSALHVANGLALLAQAFGSGRGAPSKPKGK